MKMRSIITMTLLAAGVATLVARPASAQVVDRQGAERYNVSTVYNKSDPDVVIESGQYIGRDPDPQVRAELRKNAGSYLGNSY